jgi:hypothetical protein
MRTTHTRLCFPHAPPASVPADTDDATVVNYFDEKEILPLFLDVHTPDGQTIDDETQVPAQHWAALGERLGLASTGLGSLHCTALRSTGKPAPAPMFPWTPPRCNTTYVYPVMQMAAVVKYVGEAHNYGPTPEEEEIERKKEEVPGVAASARSRTMYLHKHHIHIHMHPHAHVRATPIPISTPTPPPRPRQPQSRVSV